MINQEDLNYRVSQFSHLWNTAQNFPIKGKSNWKQNKIIKKQKVLTQGLHLIGRKKLVVTVSLAVLMVLEKKKNGTKEANTSCTHCDIIS